MVLSDSLYCNETLGNLEQLNFFSLLVLSGAKTPFQAIKCLKHNKIIIIITEKFVVHSQCHCCCVAAVVGLVWQLLGLGQLVQSSSEPYFGHSWLSPGRLPVQGDAPKGIDLDPFHNLLGKGGPLP